MAKKGSIPAYRRGSIREYFKFMGKYWSCDKATFEYLLKTWETEQAVPNLTSFPDIKELSRCPGHLSTSDVPIIGNR